MLENYVHTDLALELKEEIPREHGMQGVQVETLEDKEYGITKTRNYLENRFETILRLRAISYVRRTKISISHLWRHFTKRWQHC